MTTQPRPAVTDFTRDVMGRYICNGLDEAMLSSDPNARPDASRGPRPDARPFDVIIIGGGSFGGVLAQHLFFADKSHKHRVLVLEGGPFALAEHVQNLAMIGLGVADASSIADLRRLSANQQEDWKKEVWGLAWHSNDKYPGLAYCIGGRSMFFGGWSPQLLDAEMSVPPWPAAVVSELKTKFFDAAMKQIGTDETNDFIHGPLHSALRQQLFDGINANQVRGAIPFSELPVVLKGIDPADEDLFKLEAPLAVQSQTRTGFFPFNKFSSIPLLMKAARAAQVEVSNDDVKKRLMIVPKCHVIRLVTSNQSGVSRVGGIDTNQGFVPVPANGVVVVALGTIESARLVRNTFGPGGANLPNAAEFGANFMAHLRSNLDIRVPRTAISALDPAIKELQASALFVKGRHTFADGTPGHFHLQITAAGLGELGTDSELELFKKVPDIDGFEPFYDANDTHVVITIRGIGEMQAGNADSFVRLDPEPDEFQIPRAFVQLTTNAKDRELWDAMDQCADDVAKVFAGGGSPTILSKRRDGLGTTHHEAGALRMGDDASKSATDSDARIHHTANAYVMGPALFPTIGSPNPMLTGVALARRLAEKLGKPEPYVAEAGFTALFNGFDTRKWHMTTIKNQSNNNPGYFLTIDGALETVAGNDMGIFWCTIPTPRNFILKLEWLRWTHDANSGVYLRFPDPESKGYNNTAYVADTFGFEVQIDELGQPDGRGIHRTGAIYRKDNREDNEVLNQKAARPAGEWNEYEIRVEEQLYTVKLNSDIVCEFDNTNLYPNRGLPSAPGAPTFIGLQCYANPSWRVAFRKIRIKEI